jgi:twinkle protein
MLNIITGIPGHGKSSIMDAIMVSLSKLHNFRWGIFSPENHPQYFHIQKLMELWEGKSFFVGNNCFDRESYEACKTEMLPYFCFFNPSEDHLKLSYILELAEFEMESNHLDGIVIDPWNELEDELNDRETETKFIGRALGKCRRFARKHDLIFYILAHPKMMYKKPGEKKYEVPRLYHISGSANWYNRTDNGLCIYRNFEKGEESIDIHVQKIKFKSHGAVGAIKMKYDFFTGRLTEMEDTYSFSEIEEGPMPNTEIELTAQEEIGF